MKKPMALEKLVPLTRIGLIALFAVALLGVLHPEIREEARAAMLRDFRRVLSTATGDLVGNGTKFTVVKVQTRETLFIEIYESADNGVTRMLEKIQLSDRRDGYFNFNGQATNLAIEDIDNDGRSEILAPSFDADLVGHLNIFSYNPVTREFQRLLQ